MRRSIYMFFIFLKKKETAGFSQETAGFSRDGWKKIFSAGIGFLKKIKYGSEGFIHGP
jgi:hypothetical protein